MTEAQPLEMTGLEAKSPFELRVNRSQGYSESAIKQALTTGDIGFLHSFTTGSTVDGPGVRVVAWTSGCHWRCQYFNNPDTWNLNNGTPVPLERAVDELKKYRQGLNVMAGGFTLSGGEPLMQDRFAAKLFSAAKAMKIHTALDTNGHLGERLSDDELKAIDLVMLDIKTWDPDRHQKLTGKGVGPTLDFARRLSQLNRAVWVRYVLLPGLTDDRIDVSNVANFTAKLGNVQRVDVLPFHQMGRYKWKELGIPYKLERVEPPEQALVERVLDQFHAVGLKAV